VDLAESGRGYPAGPQHRRLPQVEGPGRLQEAVRRPASRSV